MTDKHSPTPYKATWPSQTSGNCVIKDANNRTVCIIELNLRRINNTEVVGEIANKIVTAVNSHAALMETMQKAIDMAREAQGEYECVTPLYTPEELHPYKEIESILTAALTLAEAE